MAERFFAFVLHASAAGIMLAGYKGLETTVLNTYITSQKGGHAQFLTIQALALALLTTIFSLVTDVLPSFTLARKLKRAFFIVALPVTVVVFAIYWSLLFLFPHLILQGKPGSTPPSSTSSAQAEVFRIPLSLDLALHAAPAVSLLLDFFAFERAYGRFEAGWGATIATSLFGIWYAVWVEYCAGYNGTFPYPFLNNPLPVRIAIYTVVINIAVASFRGINKLHIKLNGQPFVRTKKE